MAKEHIGKVILREREAQGISRQELCGGFCDISTLYRLEVDGQKPKKAVLEYLLQRLGLPDDLCRVVQSQKELDLAEQVDEVRSCTIRYFHAAPEDRAACRAEALEAIRELETMTDPMDNITRQFIEDGCLNLGREDGSPYPPAERRQRLLDILRMTQPHFDPEHISELCYSIEETELINQIAITYIDQEEHQKAITIYRRILECIQRPGRRLSAQFAGQFILLSTGYARELDVMKRYEESLEVAQRARRTCIKYGHYYCLPVLLAIMANCHAHLNRREEAARLYVHALCIYQEFEQLGNIKHLKNDARDTLGLELS